MSSVSNLTAVRALISALPRKELQALDKEIRGLIEASPKKTRVAAVGQKAWFAFMRHCRDTMADRFTAGMKAPEMAVVCKAIRQEDEAIYTASEEAAEAAPLSDTEASPSSATKPVKRVRLSPEAKAAKEAAEAQEKEAKKAEKARAKAEKEAKDAQEKADKAAARAAKSPAKSKSPPKVKDE